MRSGSWHDDIDDATRRTPWRRPTSAVLALLLINVAVFFFRLVYSLFTGDHLRNWVELSRANLAREPLLGLLNFITYQFSHSYDDPWHIIFNMWVFWVCGTILEPMVGPRRLTWIYLLSGFLGGVGWILFTMAIDSRAPTVGASGAVYGILVYAACVHPRMELMLFFVRLQFWAFAALLVGVAVYLTLISLRRGESGSAADAAHVGGALMGFVLFRLDRAGWMNWLERWQSRAQEHRQKNDEGRLDAILLKIKEKGMSALTGSERRFLERESKKRQHH